MVAMSNSSDLEFSLPGQQSEVGRNRHPRWLLSVISLLLMGLLTLFVADRLFQPEKFQIHEIEVNGRFSKIVGDQVKQVIESTLQGNYFSLNLARLEREVEAIPGVFSASLRRRWPSAIVVDIVEIQPVARWGNDQWLNFTGDVVARTDVALTKPINKLPLLYGPPSEIDTVWKTFQKWSGKFASNGLSLDQLELDSKDLWQLKLSLGALSLNQNHLPVESQAALENQPTVITMVVNRAQSSSRIQRFINTLNQQLISRFSEIESVDLRYPNGFAIDWRESSHLTNIAVESNSNALVGGGVE